MYQKDFSKIEILLHFIKNLCSHNVRIHIKFFVGLEFKRKIHLINSLFLIKKMTLSDLQ